MRKDFELTEEEKLEGKRRAALKMLETTKITDKVNLIAIAHLLLEVYMEYKD